MSVCVAGTEWVDPEDPTVIAENELLGAAAAIEAAAKKLEQLRPRTKPKVIHTCWLRPRLPDLSSHTFTARVHPERSRTQEADESLNFEEQILEAAKSIAAATSALVKAASAAQRELVAQGKVSSHTDRCTDPVVCPTHRPSDVCFRWERFRQTPWTTVSGPRG